MANSMISCPLCRFMVIPPFVIVSGADALSKELLREQEFFQHNNKINSF